MSIAIKFQNVSKQYRLGEVGTGTLSHDLHRTWARMRGKPDPFAKVGLVNDRTIKSSSTLNSQTSSPGSDYVWALRDIEFKVQRGEILGIIGRNGAGKSTLLKILSQVTAPTTGSIKARGRIASLLEVGTGFHPELTGRENIYLNGAILGMRRHEITKQLDEIVEFSGCAKYIDTPVKRYSSGMTVRLGFAVAAHLDCEILVVDEVLAVGDAEFQKKCIGKMQEVSRGHGKTVLFVSHNMASIENLCRSGILLANGTIKTIGSQLDAIRGYTHEAEDHQQVPLRLRNDRRGNQRMRITRVLFRDSSSGSLCEILSSGMELTIIFEYESDENLTSVPIQLAFNVRDSRGNAIANLNTRDTGLSAISLQNSGRVECHWKKLNLKEGTYSCTVFCAIQDDISDWIEDAFCLRIEGGDYYGSGTVLGGAHGPVLIDHSWNSNC